MAESCRRRYERLEVDALLERYSGLRIEPSRGQDLVLSGTLAFLVVGPARETIEDQYDIRISVHPDFPTVLPRVRELGGRIPETYHKLVGDFLCLAAPTELRWKLRLRPTLPRFVEAFVIPYLYGYSFFTKHGRLPYGELAHGDEGIRDFLSKMFGAPQSDCSEDFLRLGAMKKRDANKRPCPCRSGFRLGKCHNRRVNRLREQLGRHWFRAEYRRVIKLLDGKGRDRKTA